MSSEQSTDSGQSKSRLHDQAEGASPLLLAVDRGDYEFVTNHPVPYGPGPGTEGRRALDLARYWCEAGAEAELRRRSGVTGPAERMAVRHDGDWVSHELSLGGLKVRTGHAAILTYLESKYGIAPSFEELKHRALAEGDVEHVVWLETTSVLWQRQLRTPTDPNAVWNAAAALADSPDPLERRFGADVLYCIDLFDESDDFPFDGPLGNLFLSWAAREEDSRVLRVLANGLSGTSARAVPLLTALTRHADPHVRAGAVSGLSFPVNAGDEEAVAAVVERARDEVPAVRRSACQVLGAVPAGHPDITVAHTPAGPLRLDTLAACLSDEEEDVRVTAAFGLGMSDDPRADDVLRLYEGLGEDSSYHWELYSVWARRRRREQEGF
ncbi:HEAT repeat domain-containing protein [Streptomyces sp. NPDC001678]|uniref:HEAT repeat domain-containing protein n=1 Tax=Streptomyces sp. NPDC001678 TaxID=3364599 RepID=UPI0036C52A54